MKPALYLIPNLLGDTPVDKVLPPYNREIILSINHFIVEDVRTARRFLKLVDRSIDIDKLTFVTLNKHTDSVKEFTASTACWHTYTNIFIT